MTDGLHRLYGGNDLHFLTFSCYRRRPLFRNEAYCDLLLKILDRVRRRYRFVVLGYVVMPEHVHLLVSEPQRGTLSTAIQALELGVVRSMRCSGGSVVAAPRSRKIGETWAPQSLGPQFILTDSGCRGFMISMFGRSASGLKKLRYIHRNPVERGLELSTDLCGEAGPVRINDTDILVMRIRPPAA